MSHPETKGRRTFLAAVDELSGVHSLGGDESLLSHLVPVRVSEDNPSERGAATRVMDDVLQSTPATPCRLEFKNGCSKSLTPCKLHGKNCKFGTT